MVNTREFIIPWVIKTKRLVCIVMKNLFMKKIKKILNKNEFWMGVFTLATTWWLFNVGVLSSLVMIIPLLIAVTRP